MNKPRTYDTPTRQSTKPPSRQFANTPVGQSDNPPLRNPRRAILCPPRAPPLRAPRVAWPPQAPSRSRRPLSSSLSLKSAPRPPSSGSERNEPWP
eukprot:2966699-Alexandrium_andersonii.AAC.1